MALYQLLNCATRDKSIITFDDTKVLHVARWETSGKEAAHVLPAMLEGCDAVGATMADLTALYVVHGPGSFTGLRVAVTVANMVAAVHKQVQLFPVTVGQLLAHIDGHNALRYVFAPYASDVFVFDDEGNFLERIMGNDWQPQDGDAGELVPAMQEKSPIREVSLEALSDMMVLQSLREHLTPAEGQLLPFYAKDANITTPKHRAPLPPQ